MKVLVIDDDAMIQAAVAKKLKDKGHTVTQIGDGIKALKVLKEDDFDLIITDILMPGLSGFDLLNLLKRFYLNKVPVLIMSALAERELVGLSYELGANDFIAKPINFNELYQKIDRIVH